jgi:hypothetical protein
MWRLYKTGYWIDNWIYWVTHSYTQLQCITLYNSLLQLQLFWHSLPSFTNSLQLVCSLNSELMSEWMNYDRRSVGQPVLVSINYHPPLLCCLATVVNKHFHCWLLTYSVHVTISSTDNHELLLRRAITEQYLNVRVHNMCRSMNEREKIRTYYKKLIFFKGD